MIQKLAARIMAAGNREAILALVKDLSAKDIIVLKEQYGVTLDADEEDQAQLEKLRITKQKIAKIEKKALDKKNSHDSD